jgi:hypothetical protein
MQVPTDYVFNNQELLHGIIACHMETVGIILTSTLRFYRLLKLAAALVAGPL